MFLAYIFLLFSSTYQQLSPKNEIAWSPNFLLTDQIGMSENYYVHMTSDDLNVYDACDVNFTITKSFADNTIERNVFITDYFVAYFEANADDTKLFYMAFDASTW